jgi:hypothetical protein
MGKLVAIVGIAVALLAGAGLYFLGNTTAEESDVSIEATFEHVKPGEYSEIRQTVKGLKPGTQVAGKLNGQGKQDAAAIAYANEDGTAVLVWRITSYGEYWATAEADDPMIAKTLKVDVK